MSSFHERQKNLFNHLKDAEDQCGFSTANKATAPPDYGVIDKRTYRKLKHEMKQFRGKESIYKRQDANLRDCLKAKTMPDYIKNPKKWVYYSLADVTADQMSDATNTATALAIMRQKEEEAEALKMVQDNEDTVFKKPTFQISSTLKKLPKENEKTVFKNNKIIMPEYVVGVSRKKEQKDKVVRRISQDNTSNSKKEKKADLKLNHLFEDDEEET